MSRSPPLRTHRLDPIRQGFGLFDGNRGRLDKGVQPPVDGRIGLGATRGRRVAKRGETFDVAIAQGGQYKTDRNDRTVGQAATGQHGVNERTPDPAIPVGERVNRLELGMDHRRLDQGRMRGTVQIGNEIGDQATDPLRVRRDEGSADRGGPARGADPVLDRTQTMMPRLVAEATGAAPRHP